MSGFLAAVIPVKMTDGAKTRLACVLTQEERTTLVFSMLGHMLDILADAPEIGRVYVATSDMLVRRFLLEKHAGVRALEDGGGINESAAAAARLLAREGFSSMLFLLGDLPLLCGGDISAAAALGARHRVVVMPDRERKGTNAVLLTPPGVMETHFGLESYRAHLEAAARQGLAAHVLETPGFGADLDTPEDLRHISQQTIQYGRKTQ